MLGPTASAVFEGNVHGVVVQARANNGTVLSVSAASAWLGEVISNCAVTVVSVTSR